MRTLLAFFLASHLYALGDLKVEPRYLGQTLDLTGAAYQFNVLVDGGFRGAIAYEHRSTQPIPATSLTITGLTPGVHTVSFLTNSVAWGAHSVTVVDATLTTDTFETSTAIGALQGDLLVQGAAPTSTDSYAVCGFQPSAVACYYLAAAASNFRILLPAGTRIGSVFRQLPPPGIAQTFTYAITAGQNTNYGSIAYNFGDLKIEPRFLSQALDQTNAAYDISVRLDGFPVGTIRFNNLTSQSTRPTAITVSGVSTGTHIVQFGTGATSSFNTHTVFVSTATLTTDAYELSPHLGIVKGNVLVNGAPPVSADTIIVRPNTNSANLNYALSANNTAFRILALPGAPTGAISTSGAFVVPFVFSYSTPSTAGVETDLGTIAYDYGTVKIEPRFNGQLLNQIGAAYNIGIAINGNLLSGLIYDNSIASTPSTSFQLDSAPSGPISVAFQLPGLSAVSHTYNVIPGIPNTDSYDLSSIAGIIKGNLFISGNPPTTNSSFACGRYSGGPQLPYLLRAGNPAWRILTAATTATGCVFANGPNTLKTFPYTLLPGQELLIGDVFALNVRGAITNKSGPQNARLWSYSLTNLDTAPITVTVSQFSLAQTFGTPCTPILNTTLPVNYGTITAGATATQSFTFDFSSCPANARFTLTATTTNGSTSQDTVILNQFR